MLVGGGGGDVRVGGWGGGGVDGGLVKVGGVDTEMYRTGHPHACSINLTAFCCRSCCGAHREREEVRCAPYCGGLCGVWRGLFHTDQRSPSPQQHKAKKKNGMLSLSLSARSVSTEE